LREIFSAAATSLALLERRLMAEDSVVGLLVVLDPLPSSRRLLLELLRRCFLKLDCPREVASSKLDYPGVVAES